MSTDALNYELKDEVAALRFDDGKVNALSHTVLDALSDALDRATKDEAKVVTLIGRTGVFCAGFDLSVMRQGPKEAAELLHKGGLLSQRILEWPTPILFAVTGHALAMGAVILCTADERIGAEGDFKIGLNEVAIGMTLPDFALELARERLSRRHFYRATTAAEIYSPAGAMDAGFLDHVVSPDEVVEATLARARDLASRLDPTAYRNTKRAIQGDLTERLRRLYSA
jgi:enoyl-CoA hydratase